MPRTNALSALSLLSYNALFCTDIFNTESDELQFLYCV